MKYLVMLFLFITSGCTFAVTTVHTQGRASDVVDETQGAEAQVDPNVSLTP